MEEKAGENETQNQSEQIDEQMQEEEIQETEKIEEEAQEIQEIQEIQEDSLQEDPVQEEIEEEPEQIETEKEEQETEQEAAPKEQETNIILEEGKPEKKRISYPIPVTRIGLFLRGLLAIALGALMFMYQDNALQILGILLGCLIILMSGLNIIIGYRERFKAFYGKWLIIAGILGLVLGVITVCVPLLISPFVFLFLTVALVILGCGDIVLAIYSRRMPEIMGALALLGLVSIVAGVLIYMYPDNLITFFCTYAIAAGVLSVAISLFIKKKRSE